MKVLLGLIFLMSICMSRGVMAEEKSDCLIESKITIFAMPMDTDQKDCNYHISTITTFQLTGPIDTKTVLSSVAIPLASLLGLEQDEVIHDCSKTQVFENHTKVIMRSYFDADIDCLKEKLDLNKDDIFDNLVEGSDCWVKKNPVTRLFLLGNHNKNRPKEEPKPPKELKPPETAKKYNI